MKELDFLNIIKNKLTKNSSIGDDCAYLKDLGIVVTQDTLVQDVHFSLEFSSPYQLGYKAIVVNLSDIFASGAIPKYVTISLSLPNSIDETFIEEFYRACNDLASEYDFEIVGGDLTGSDKIFISICAIGLTKGHKISSRSHAKVGDWVITTGVHGSSAAGLNLLLSQQVGEKKKYANLIDNHLMPTPQKDFSNDISTNVQRDYAMMDTSDGLMDALFKIAKASGVMIEVDFEKIPFDKEIEEVAKDKNIDFKDWIFYGGEDYQIVACLDESGLKKLTQPYHIIGKVSEKNEEHFVELHFADKTEKIYNLDKTFNHFGDEK